MTVHLKDLMELVQREATLPLEAMKPEATLEELGLDSLDVVSIVFAIEDKYGVDIDVAEMADIPTLAGLYEFVSARLPSTVE